MQHGVVLHDEVEMTACPGHARELREDAVGVRNRLQHVPANDEIEAPIGQPEIEDAPHFEPNAVAETCVPLARDRERAREDVDAEHLRHREQRREPPGDLSRPTPGVEDASAIAQPIAREERRLLRPYRVRLRGERPHHRLVRHLLPLRIEAHVVGDGVGRVVAHGREL
jgi:hypothetical protein